MSRPLRIEFPGALYHLTARGNARENIFLDDEDRLRFLDLLAKEIDQQRWRCYAYCLMSNHYHLLIETPQPNLTRGMRRLNGVYTQAFNRRHTRVGHVLQGRYKSIIVDRDSYLLELARYIVLNPVRAKMVKRVGDWPWSSYRATLGEAARPSWLASDYLIEQFGRRGRSAYRDFVTAGIGQASVWEGLRGQIWLGSEAFLKRMQGHADRRPTANVPSVQRAPARPRAQDVLAQVGKVYGLNKREMLDRGDPEAFQCAVYLLRRAANLPIAEVSRLAGVSAARVSQIQSRIERAAPDRKLAKLLTMYKVKN